MILNVHNLPQHVAERELAGSTVVVIDVLRATSTICQALSAGAREVVPFLEVQEAIAAAEREDRTQIILGGERGGRRIAGFDLGNSPAEYTPQRVAGRRVFITTTNGTRTMYHARQAKRVVVGSFLNLSAVVASIKNEPRIAILCAGTDGAETGEDIWAAGGIVNQLCHVSAVDWQLNNTAAMAGGVGWGRIFAQAQLSGRAPEEVLADEMRTTPGGRNLVEIGLEHDLVDCAQIDRLAVVPELDVHQWRIILPNT